MKKAYFSPSRILSLINFWPTFFFQGISVKKLDNEIFNLEVKLEKRFFNLNYVGTHFGGSLYSMTDPWFMLILMHHLGPNYTVWDKNASIEFIRPGSGVIKGLFTITQDEIEKIKGQLENEEQGLFYFQAILKDSQNKRVARVKKTLFVKKENINQG